MKKEIMELLKNDDGIFRLNNISFLYRWTKNALGEPYDGLSLEFDNVNNWNFDISNTEIKSRDYDGIISECSEITTRFLNEISRTLCKNLKAGYNFYKSENYNKNPSNNYYLKVSFSEAQILKDNGIEYSGKISPETSSIIKINSTDKTKAENLLNATRKTNCNPKV